MVVWCSPRNAPHDVRVKVSPVHGDRMIENSGSQYRGPAETALSDR